MRAALGLNIVVTDLWLNHVVEATTGWTSEFIEMMQVGLSHSSILRRHSIKCFRALPSRGAAPENSPHF